MQRPPFFYNFHCKSSGTFNAKQGAATCQPCPAGYYCEIRTADYSEKPCPKGSYCPTQSASGLPIPCPAGTFSPSQRLMQGRQCQTCPPGKVCSFKGIEGPSESCPAGSYCIGGGQSEESDGLSATCEAGNYCPEGVSLPIICSPGRSEVYACPSKQCLIAKRTFGC